MGKIFLNSVQYAGSSNTTKLHRYTASLTSSQYGWFTLVDENGNYFGENDQKYPILVSAYSDVSGKYHVTQFISYDNGTKYIFKAENLNNVNSPTIETGEVTIDFDIAYVEYSASSLGTLNYSETEHIVGTWIDGSPVYEKTYTGTISGNQTTISTFSEDIIIIGGEGGVRKNAGAQMMLGCLGTVNDWRSGVHIASGTLYLFTANEITTGTYYVTIRYIKVSAS